MLTIEDKPNRPVCSIHGPVRWGFFTDTKQGDRWVSFTFADVPDLGVVLVPHSCTGQGPAPVRWEPDPAVAERAHRGNELVRRVLAGDNPFND